MREGRTLFVDDATLIPPTVLAVVYPAMDGRRQIIIKANGGEVVTAAEGFYVVAGHNPGVHGAVLSDSLSSRFSAQIQVSTDYDLATQLKIDRRAVRVARNLGCAGQRDRCSLRGGRARRDRSELLRCRRGRGGGRNGLAGAVRAGGGIAVRRVAVSFRLGWLQLSVAGNGDQRNGNGDYGTTHVRLPSASCVWQKAHQRGQFIPSQSDGITRSFQFIPSRSDGIMGNTATTRAHEARSYR